MGTNFSLDQQSVEKIQRRATNLAGHRYQKSALCMKISLPQVTISEILTCPR